jgi:LysM repeat protein
MANLESHLGGVIPKKLRVRVRKNPNGYKSEVLADAIRKKYRYDVDQFEIAKALGVGVDDFITKTKFKLPKSIFLGSQDERHEIWKNEKKICPPSKGRLGFSSLKKYVVGLTAVAVVLFSSSIGGKVSEKVPSYNTVQKIPTGMEEVFCSSSKSLESRCYDGKSPLLHNAEKINKIVNESEIKPAKSKPTKNELILSRGYTPLGNDPEMYKSIKDKNWKILTKKSGEDYIKDEDILGLPTIFELAGISRTIDFDIWEKMDRVLMHVSNSKRELEDAMGSHVDASDLSALCAVESSCDSRKASGSNALGLLQIKRVLYGGGELSNGTKYSSFNPWSIKDAVEFKAKWKLQEQYGNQFLAFTAHNSGETRLNKAIRHYIASIKKIPLGKIKLKDYKDNQGRFKIELPKSLIDFKYKGGGYILTQENRSFAKKVERAKQIQQNFVPVEHRIEEGDTFWKIARVYGTSVGNLQRSNQDMDPLRLQIGDKVNFYVPRSQYNKAMQIAKNFVPVEHRIEEGDTFWEIAKSYGISVDNLQRSNQDMDPLRLQIGDKVSFYVPRSQYEKSHMG